MSAGLGRLATRPYTDELFDSSGAAIAEVFGRNRAVRQRRAQELLRAVNDRAVLVQALEIARATIRALHGPAQWELYERCSPEMQRIDAALATVTP